MTGETLTPREMIIETRRDVKWIRETLEEIKQVNEVQNERITKLERQHSRWLGRDGALVAIISAAVAFLTALFSGGCVR